MNNSSKNNSSYLSQISDTTIMNVMEMAEYLNIGKNRAYNLLNSGEIHGFRIGNSWKVSRLALDKYIIEHSGLDI